MDKIWNYKNFNMVVELDVSGEFIYNGIHEINRLTGFSNDGATFSALYSLAVGIERLQKIVYVLWGMDCFDDEEAFENSLITHSHTGLRDKVNEFLERKGESISFSARENEFLLLLTHFYNSARYIRFNIDGEWAKEVYLLRPYIAKYVDDNIDDIFNPERLIATDKVKEFFGRVVGSIAKKYYDFIIKGSRINNTYTYELKSDSKAGKIFLGNYKKNSLIEGQIDERIALKELLIYLRCSKDKTPYFKFVDEIEPLEFDPYMVMEYLEEIVSGNIPQDLIDTVDYLYSENKYSIDRVEKVDLFANSMVCFDGLMKEDCWNIIQKIEAKNLELEDIEQLKENRQFVEDEDILVILDKVIQITEDYHKNRGENTKVFHDNMKKLSSEYQEYYKVDNCED